MISCIISKVLHLFVQIENMKNTSKLAEVVLDGKSIEFLLLKKSIEDKLSTIASLDEKLNTLPSTIDKVVILEAWNSIKRYFYLIKDKTQIYETIRIVL